MSSQKTVAVILVLCMVMTTTLHASEIDDVSCSEAVSSLLPCLPFLEGSLPATPSADCCTGATNLFNKANTTPIKRSVCQCLKDASTKFAVKPDRAAQFPQLCHINVPFPISASVDCSKIQVVNKS
ncbi:non-specific lipid-transfer protein A-like [Vicia villosa]|uniref:non-specific lipid-transfer protein A-like n=1 Tax=Vicia villosa TaxID=3911 RepID=UPI00273CEEC0|nr:non-specific lipid-transfer protein A-like [Vicia villosa]XP_058782373.1 non-specific lipid-transfer protein A-like [Vicia villosa]